MSRPRSHRTRTGQSGYALITILFMLGVVAAMLARSLPRDAMRAERTREEMLIYRGEQYARAVKLYFREHQRYPESLDDLEETDGVRYLRRRYRDPITGADEWRVIKMGTDGRFEDSLVYDLEDDRPGLGSTPAAQAFAAASVNVPASSGPAVPVRQSAAPTNPFERVQGPYGGPFPGQEAVQPEVRPDGQPARGSSGDYSQVLPGQVPLNAGQAGTQPTQQDPRFGAGVPSAIAGAFPGQPTGVSPNDANQALRGGELSNQASDVIGRLLTTPRPGGLEAIRAQSTQQQLAGGQAAFQEGIAGVASKSEDSGVKVYKDRTSYNEWEFVYDYREDARGPGSLGGPQLPGTQIDQSQPGLTPSGVLQGNPGGGQTTPFSLPGMTMPPAQQQGVQPSSAPRPGPTPVEPSSSGRDSREGRSRFRPRSPAEFRPVTPMPVPAPPVGTGQDGQPDEPR